MSSLFELTYCSTCEGIDLIWDALNNEWAAPYVDGGFYCDCTHEQMKENWGLTKE